MLEFNPWLLLISALIALPIALLTVKKEMLKPAAAAVAAVMIVVIGVCGGIWAIMILLFAYLSLGVLDKIFSYGIVKATNDINKKSGARDAVQVLVNGLAACICIAVYFFTKNPVWLAAYVCGIGEAYADSLSSDIGVLSKKKPVDFFSRREVPAGMSGGVTPLGTSVGLLGSIVAAALGILCFGADVRLLISCAAGSFLGCIIDSIMGSLVQAKFRCTVCGKVTEKTEHCAEKTEHIGGIKALDNCMVNLLSNAASCGLCVGIYYLATLIF